MAFIGTINLSAKVAYAQFVTGGLVSHWSFDEIEGDTVVDVVGDNDGGINGEPQMVEGKIGPALLFDGVTILFSGKLAFRTLVAA